jgi:hypothetical protein
MSQKVFATTINKKKSSKTMSNSPDAENRLQQDPDEDSIPLADDDPSAVIVDDDVDSFIAEADRRAAKWHRGHESLDSIPSMISDSLPTSAGPSSLTIGLTASHLTEQMTRMCLDPDFSPDEAEEKARLISQVKETFIVKVMLYLKVGGQSLN